MPANYVLLGEVTLGASAASVVFSNIPQTGYTDLKVVGSLRTDRATGSVAIVSLKLNSTTTSVYSSKELGGTGSASDYGQYSNVAPTALYVGRVSQSTDTANTFGSLEVYIPNYAGSTAKSASCESVQENNATAAFAQMTAWLCTDTAAIHTLTFTTNSGTNFVANSTFYLYGLAAVGTTPVIAPFASGGDIITNDGTYWIHTFLSSGTFTPAKALTCDALVIAGGGGGNAGYAGGGAGGYRTTIGGTPLSVTAIPYSVTVGSGGAGGAAQNGNPPTAANGTSSIFSSITTSGGGGGGGGAGPNSGAGAAGGSGGGGSPGAAGGAGNTGSYSPVEGYVGGVGYASNPVYIGGGGGGAGAAGGASSGSVAGAGGAGLASSITGTSVMRGGGGGATALYNSPTSGAGGAGGGGAGGAALTAGTAGTANTGGGGGAGAVDPSNPNNRGGGNGGSGVVIIRYPIA
jgi:hypothetical protein